MGLRYLRRETVRGRPATISLLVFLVATAFGGLCFAAFPRFREFGVLLLVFGSIGLVAATLIQFFSAFTTVSILGVALGVRTLAVVLSVTTGFEREFKDKVLGVNAHVIVMKFGIDNFSEYEEVIKTAYGYPDVTGAAPFVLHQMMISRGFEQSGVLVKGIDPARVGRVLDAPRHLVSGSFDDLEPVESEGDVPGVILGSELASRLQTQTGDVIQLVALGGGSGDSPDILEAPESFDLRVAGIFHSGFDEYDRRLLYVHIERAQAFVGGGDVVTGVEMKISDIYQSGVISRRLERSLKGGLYRVVDWKELNHNLFSALRTQKIVLAIVMTLIILVAAFNIVAALTLLVVRKMREIAILKSMGVGPGGIARIFQAAGLSIGVVGAGLGVLWAIADCAIVERYGYPLDPKVYLIGRLPVEPDPVELALTAGLAVLICLLATVYPARRAVELQPVEGLRYE